MNKKFKNEMVETSKRKRNKLFSPKLSVKAILLQNLLKMFLAIHQGNSSNNFFDKWQKILNIPNGNP